MNNNLDHSFQIGDYAVYPGHGVGQVMSIEERELSGVKKYFYAVKIMANGMTVMVPVDTDNGIRSLATDQQVKEIYKVLKTHDIEINDDTWNRRYREYTGKINTGSPIEIAEVIRALFLLKNRKPLSFGEKKMLGRCMGLLSQEIALSAGAKTSRITSKIESCFSSKI